MVRPLSLAQHTLYADLLEQGADELFDAEFPENGSVLIRANRAGAPAEHAYYQGYRSAAGGADRGQRYARYLGRTDDPAVAARIARFKRVKAARAERVTTVRALIGAGMPRPDRTTGRIVEALARAGLFLDHAVLIGEAASQTYGGVLGVRLAKPRDAAGRARPKVEIVARDGLGAADILAVLRAVDPNIAPETETTVAYMSSSGVKVEVTSLDRADEETANLLSFLIDDPVHAIVLHGAGIPVSVPAPERTAVRAFIEPDTRAFSLLEAIADADRQHALARAIVIALRSKLLSNARLAEGLSQLRPDLVAMIETLI